MTDITTEKARIGAPLRDPRRSSTVSPKRAKACHRSTPPSPAPLAGEAVQGHSPRRRRRHSGQLPRRPPDLLQAGGLQAAHRPGRGLAVHPAQAAARPAHARSSTARLRPCAVTGQAGRRHGRDRGPRATPGSAPPASRRTAFPPTPGRTSPRPPSHHPGRVPGATARSVITLTLTGAGRRPGRQHIVIIAEKFSKCRRRPGPPAAPPSSRKTSKSSSRTAPS